MYTLDMLLVFLKVNCSVINNKMFYDACRRYVNNVYVCTNAVVCFFCPV